MTVNELLVLTKVVRERVNQLKSLASQCAVEEKSYFSDREKETTITPQYDLKLVDKKITQLKTWLFKADAAIKQSNAKTEVEVEADVDVLLAPLD